MSDERLPHHPECGTAYRGCHPTLCQKDQYEKTGKRLGSDASIYQKSAEVIIEEKRRAEALRNFLGMLFETAIPRTRVISVENCPSGMGLTVKERCYFLTADGQTPGVGASEYLSLDSIWNARFPGNLAVDVSERLAAGIREKRGKLVLHPAFPNQGEA